MEPTVTDNRGNGSCLNKLMSTRYPASAMIMEMASFTKKKEKRASVEWAPREGNREAVSLANGNFEGFSAEQRMHLTRREGNVGDMTGYVSGIRGESLKKEGQHHTRRASLHLLVLVVPGC